MKKKRFRITFRYIIFWESGKMGKNEKTTFQHIQAENKNSGVIENDHTVSNTAFLTLYGLANSGNDKAELL